MAYDGRYDHPRYINAFLTGQRLTIEEFAQDLSINYGNSTEKPQDHEPSIITKKVGGIITPGIISASSSPPVGTRAPPPTPESTLLAAANTEHLPPINEDPDTTHTDASQMYQQHGESTQFRATANPFHPIGRDELKASLATSPKEILHTVTPTILHENTDEIERYHQDVQKKIVADAEAKVALRSLTNRTRKNKDDYDNDPNVKITESTKPATCDEHVEIETSTGPVCEKNLDNSSSVSTGTFRDGQDESTAISEGSEIDNDDDDNSSINIIVDVPESLNSFETHTSTIIVSSPSDAAVKVEDEAIPADDVGVMLDSDRKQPEVVVKEESRQEATYFASWGEPVARDTSPARVREVILQGTPPSADLNLVQSLIHGGTIEVMTMHQSSTGSTNAYVIFTDADACDRYHAAHPNGLEYKFKGKKYITYVHKGPRVNVVSGILKSYLECGASRVVKAVNADEDWSLRALYRIAEGPNARRKIEAVIDTYSNDMRSIIFRFTNIEDAVTFRGQLLRDSEWKDADINFMADPCEKATAILWS